jgi:hypothetical protein
VRGRLRLEARDHGRDAVALLNIIYSAMGDSFLIDGFSKRERATSHLAEKVS